MHVIAQVTGETPGLDLGSVWTEDGGTQHAQHAHARQLPRRSGHRTPRAVLKQLHRFRDAAGRPNERPAQWRGGCVLGTLWRRRWVCRARWSLQQGVLGVILPATHSRRGLSNADDSIQRGSCQTRTPCDKCSATAGNMQPSARHAHLQGTNTHGAYHDDCPPKTIFTTRGAAGDVAAPALTA